MSCCPLTIPKYLCDLPDIPQNVQRVLDCVSKNVYFLNNTQLLNNYFTYSATAFPYRITIVNSNGRVIYDNTVPSQYWCLMNDMTSNLEFQLATLGVCKAVIRKEYPNCPYGVDGPGCYAVPSFVTGLTGYTGNTGNTGCPPCIDGYSGYVPYNCVNFGCTPCGCTGSTGCTGGYSGCSGYTGITGCNEADAVTYLFSTQIKVCGGQARWIRIGQPIPYGCTGCCYQPCPEPNTRIPQLLRPCSCSCKCSCSH